MGVNNECRVNLSPINGQASRITPKGFCFLADAYPGAGLIAAPQTDTATLAAFCLRMAIRLTVFVGMTNLPVFSSAKNRFLSTLEEL